MKTTFGAGVTLCVVLLVMITRAAYAVTNTWSGSGENWNDGTKWSSGAPVDGQDVVIAGNIVLTNSTPTLASFTINAGATQMWTGWQTVLTAATVTVNGTLTHTPNTDTNGTLGSYPGGWDPDARVYVVCSTFFLATNGTIDVTAKGYGSGTGATSTAYGPGGARAASGGAAYGGVGGAGNGGNSWGLAYGSSAAPEDPGSGGRNNSTVNEPGGWGGGAVKIVASGLATLNGAIRANGGPGLGANYRGAGSGGGIYLVCGTFAGTNGSITANGGDVTGGTTGGGGGGGRIAVTVTNVAAQSNMPSASVTFMARGGVRDFATNSTSGRPGTIWRDSYGLGLVSSPGGGTDVPAGWYTNGVSVTITATAAANNTFVQWSGAGVPAGSWTNNPLTVIMDRDRAIQANFATNAVVTRTWSGTGNWFSWTNWTPGGIPGAQDAVVVSSGTNVLSDPATVGSAIVTNATVLFTNWTTMLTATDVNILSGGVLTLPAAFVDTDLPYTTNVAMTNRINVVCSNFTLAAFGLINADSRGYAGWKTWYYGSGPGCPKSAAGSSHGGLGATPSCPLGAASYWVNPMPVYGSVIAPDMPGSGGDTGSGQAGGAGGGAVRIAASGAVLVNGTITANGGNGTLNYGFGGSGGSIQIGCRTFAGTNGALYASGGNGAGTAGAGAGGGRIAVVYDTAAQASLPAPNVKIWTKAGGSTGNNGGNFLNYRSNAELGTIYLPDTQFLTPVVTPFLIGRLNFAAGVTNWSVSSLTVSNAWMVFPSGFQITVTNAMNVVTGADTAIRVRVGLPNGALTCGSLAVTNGAGLYVYSGPTNPATTNFGALVSVTGTMSVASNAFVVPYSDQTNGGSVLFSVGSLLVASNGSINANTAGFWDNNGPGAGFYAGANDVTNNGGGGYGGLGGRASAGQTGGGVYGDSNAPVGPGSGGGGFCARSGGGMVRVEAVGTIRVDGSITANGGAATTGGAGAGGGIYLRCDTIAGTGVVQAVGGANASASRAAGGGGRIAIVSVLDQFNHASVVATGGVAASGGTYHGDTGTVVWTQMTGAGPWTVNALPVSGLSTTGATLNGVIYIAGSGASPEVYICWDASDRGTTGITAWAHADYMGSTWIVGQTFSNVVTGLGMGSNYSYRCYCTNSAGTNWSGVQSFQTLGFPAVTNLGAVARPRGALLRAQVTDTGASTPYTWLSYWQDGVAATTTVAAGLQSGSFSVSVMGLYAGSNYSYRAMASNSIGIAWSDIKGFVPLGAVTNTWSGSGQDWSDTNRWSGGAVPVDGEDVILSGNVSLTNATPYLASYTLLSGATNTVSGWGSVITAGVVTINGTLTHTTNTDVVGTVGSYPGGWTPDSRVYVVCSSFTLATGGTIDVSEKGYIGSEGSTGYGPGGALSGWSGGGYGARGGGGNSPSGGGTNYGSASAPEDPGSSGAGNGAGSPGGAGGGVVKIVASGLATLNGAIRANGGPGLGANYRGAGSGGGIYLVCGTFAGTNGSITANGGDVTTGTTGGGGGGGRIAVTVTNVAAQSNMPSASVTFMARGGVRDYAVNSTAGRPGTIGRESYCLGLASSPGGGTDLSTGWYTNGASATITATAAANNTFVQWSGSGVPAGSWTNNPLTVIMDRDRAIQASFATNAVVTRTWSGTGNWFSWTNWTPAGVPGAQDAVVVNSGTNVLSDPATVGSVLVTNATVLFTNWTAMLTATDINIVSGGVLTLPAAFVDTDLPYTTNMPMTNRINVVCSNFTLAAFGLINADSRGYAGWKTWYAGSGPGCPKNNTSGASHGGPGATPSCPSSSGSYAAPGAIYDELENPNAPGSGGDTGTGDAGGAGGGVVRIAASGAVVISGTVTANGGNGSLNYGFGGSGGSIQIGCRTFAATNGILRAGGGNGGVTAGAGGGGGRIAIVYDAGAQAAMPVPVLQLWVKAGTSVGNNGGNWYNYRQNAGVGTVYLPDTLFLSAPLKPYLIGRLAFASGATNWGVDSLTVSNASILLPAGFKMKVTNEFKVVAGAGVGVGLPNGELNCGSLTVSNGGALYVYSGPTNAAVTNYGALVRVTGAMSVASNATVYPYCDQTNGGAVLFSVGSLLVASNGVMNANSAGFWDNNGPGAGYYAGANDVTNNGAGGYGGIGGRASVGQAGGGVYGSSNAPVGPGSGGGGFSARSGGGVVRVEASGAMRVDGLITANGGAASAGGSGAGGGIYLRCGTMSGAGMLQAVGGTNATVSRAAGGGGRIAVAYLRNLFNTNNASAAGGVATSGGTFSGADGTVVWIEAAPLGSVFLFR